MLNKSAVHQPVLFYTAEVSRKKVVHIIHEGSGGGGATLSLNYFPRYLEHFETTAIVGNAGNLAERLRAAGVKTWALPLDRPVRCLLSIPLMAWRLWQEKPDAVVVHGQWGGFAGAVAAWITRVPKIIYYTHMPCFYTDWDLYRILRNRIAEQVTCQIADQVICPSAANRYQYLLRQLAQLGKIGVIPNGIDIDRIKPIENKAELRTELGLPVDKTVVVSVGRLSDQKRVDWLVRAWAQVEKENGEAELFIVGDGEERANLELLARKLALQRCHFFGKQPDGYRYFQAADFGVITTLFEAQPYALLEAMGCGCPMIGTEADGVVETLRGRGLLVPCADMEKMSEAILYMIRNRRERSEIGQKALEWIREKMDLREIVRRQLNLI